MCGCLVFALCGWRGKHTTESVGQFIIELQPSGNVVPSQELRRPIELRLSLAGLEAIAADPGSSGITVVTGDVPTFATMDRHGPTVQDRPDNRRATPPSEGIARVLSAEEGRKLKE